MAPAAAATGVDTDLEAGSAADSSGAAPESNDAGTTAAAAAPIASGSTGTALPTAFARQPHPAGTPQAAGVPAGGHSAVSSTGPIAGLPDAMVWLGVGLVGVGTAAGLVFFRLRRPW